MSTIRRCSPADFDTVVVLELEVFGSQAWSPRSVEEEFDQLDDTRTIWLVEVHDENGQVKPVGYAVGRYVGDVADVQRVGVLASRRRGGLGRLLLEHVVVEAGRRGCARIMLDVKADNNAAVALYERAGFEVIDRRPRYYTDGVDALIFVRQMYPDSPPEAQPEPEAERDG